MKRLTLIALLVVAVLALGASPASAKRASCAEAAKVLALPTTRSADSNALQLYYKQRCGRRVSPLFG